MQKPIQNNFFYTSLKEGIKNKNKLGIFPTRQWTHLCVKGYASNVPLVFSSINYKSMDPLMAYELFSLKNNKKI